ncbi:MAG: glycosyltransferase [Clostridium sp.]
MKYYFVRNKEYRPSTYYRLYQYLEEENIKEFQICEYEVNKYYTSNINRVLKKIIYGFIPGYYRRILKILKILKTTDDEIEIFIQREIFPNKIFVLDRILLIKMLKRAKKIYWDFDDDILESKEISQFEFDTLSKYSDKIYVGNEMLRQKINDRDISKVNIINTTDKYCEKVNLKDILKRRNQRFKYEINFVWLGTAGNLENIDMIISGLDKIAQKSNKKINLNVISNKDYIRKTEYLIIKNIKWERQRAYDVLEDMHIGVMPLKDTTFNEGKCAFKAIQYMGFGIPILISPVGLNKEILNENGYFIDNENWENNILELINNQEKWGRYSKKSKEEWEYRFNSKNIKELLRI